jgi:DNA-binding response OmpR family regulator
MKPKRLLVIDDAPDFGAFVRRVAERLDFQTEVTADPRTFKNLYQSLDPTVILLDIVMPEADGIELLTWLRSANCRARVLLISGFDPRYAEWAVRLGGAGGPPVKRLNKPISVADLEAALAV